MTPQPTKQIASRRDFILGAAGGALLFASSSSAKTTARLPGVLGIAYPSFAVRMRLAREKKAEKLTAESLLELCRSFGARGGQLDFAHFVMLDAPALKRLRAALDKDGMFLEFSVGADMLGDANAMAQIARAANALGVTLLRTAMLGGRRYEDFKEIVAWKEFVAKSERTLAAAEPLLRRHNLILGVENHKDWQADQLAGLLKRLSSSHVGACVDFGNNLALLEDSLSVVEALAPYVVTTHLKDMGVRAYADGLQLSEVPLGEGILPLAQLIGILRRKRPDVHFCLEMITRDPLLVPYLRDDYWLTYDRRDDARVARFRETVLAKAATKPLPTINNLSETQMLAAEDDNIRRSLAYAKEKLNL